MSDEKLTPTLNAYNFSGTISEKLRNFLAENNVSIIEKDNFSDEIAIHYVFVDGKDDFKSVVEKVSAFNESFDLIATSKVEDIYLFLKNKGKFVISDQWLESPIGDTFFKRFLQGAGSVKVDDNIGSYFERFSSMNIINHLRLGHYGDTISIDAFEKDFNLVAIRGFLYNVVYYFTYLKQAGIAGVPFEVMYSANENHFVLNIHASVKNFLFEYVMDCFGNMNSKDNLQYLLKSSYLLSDFMEITYMSEPSKIVFTAVWNHKSSKEFSTFNGLSINNIKTAKEIENGLYQKLKKSEVSGEESVDYGKKVYELENKEIPGGFLEEFSAEADEENIFFEDPNLIGDLINHIHVKLGEDYDFSKVRDEEFNELIKGHKLEDELLIRLKDSDKEFVYNKLSRFELSNSFEVSIARQRDDLNSEKYLENYKNEIKSEIKIRTENNDKIEVNQEEVETKLQEVLNDLLDDDLKIFKNNKIIARQMAEKIFIYLKDSVRKGHEAFEDEVYKALATVKRREREYLASIVSGKGKDQHDSDLGGLSHREEVLISKLKKSESEIEELKRKLKASMVALGAVKQVEDEKKQFQKQLEEEIKEIETSGAIDNENSDFGETQDSLEEKQLIVESLKNGNVSEELITRLEELMAKESSYIEKAKKLELDVRKKAIESSQKEALYEQQLIAKERLLKAKDTAIENVRDNLKILTAKKDNHIKLVGQRLSAMTSELNQLKASNNESKIKTLEKEKIDSQKTIDSYRNQMEALRNKIHLLESSDETDKLNEEIRKLKRESIALESKFKSMQAEQEMFRRKLKEEEEKSRALMAQVKELKESGTSEQMGSIEQSYLVEIENLKVKLADSIKNNTETEKQLSIYELKINQLESQVEKADQAKDLATKISNTENPDMKRLKTQVERLEKDRAKMIEDARKVKAESVEAVTNHKKALADIKGLENKIKAMEREAEKSRKKIDDLSKKLIAASQKKAA